jgi:hypothetical protein
MVAKSVFALLSVLGLVALAACTPIVSPTASAPTAEIPTATVVATTESEDEAMNHSDSDLAVFAQQDLATRLGLGVEQVEVLDVVETTWPDASLGCPQPGMVYAQVEQTGLVIRLRADGKMYFYHSGEAQQPFLCEAMTLNVPTDDEFVPPPGSKVD